MLSKLTSELRQALAKHAGGPVRVEDPETHVQYVLVQFDMYEQLRRDAELDTSEPNPRDFYPLFAAAIKEDRDMPRRKHRVRRTSSRRSR